MTLAKLVNQTKAVAILRIFARSPEEVEEQGELAIAAARRLLKNGFIEGRQFIDQVLIYVWADQSFVDLKGERKCDCGLTASYVEARVRDDKRIRVHNFVEGDLFADVLNVAIGEALLSGHTWAFILSPPAASYATPESIYDMVAAAAKGARIVGLAIDELTDSILKGRVANTMALWHLPSLIKKRLFPEEAAMPRDERDPRCRFVMAHNEKGDLIAYPVNGVEEIPVIVRFFVEWGACVAVLRPRGDGVKQYVLPTDPETLRRHLAKMKTKETRMRGLLSLFTIDGRKWMLEALQEAVLPEYREK